MVDTVIDIVGAKEFLKQNPDAGNQFDQRYGEGATYAILNDEYVNPEETAARAAALEAEQGRSTFKDVLVGVADGVEQAINETGQTLNSVNQWIEEKTNTGRLVWEDKDGDGKVDLIPSYWPREKVVENAAMLNQDPLTGFMEELDVVPEPERMAGSVTKGFSQFLSGFLLLGGGKGGAIRALATGAVVDATVFDPYEANLSKMAEEAEWTGPHLDRALATLATNPDDPEWQNRLRNSIEGGIAGIAVDGVIKGVRMVAATRRARKEIKVLGKVSDETSAEIQQLDAEIAEIAEAQNRNLTAKDDGTFEGPDGTVYEPDGDKLKIVSKPPEVNTAAPTQPEAPDVGTSGSDRISLFDDSLNPDLPARPEAPDAPEVGNSPAQVLSPEPSAMTKIEGKKLDGQALADQTRPKKISTLPKVSIVDEPVLRATIARMKEMNFTDIKALEDGGAFNVDTMDGLMTGDRLIDAVHQTLKDEGVAKALKFEDPVTLQQTAAESLKYISRTTNKDVNVLIKDLNATETMTRDLATKIVAGKMALQTTARKITDLSNILDDAVNANKGTEEAERSLFNAMQMHMEVQANVKSMQTAAARATSAGRIRTDAMLSADTLDGLSAFGGSLRVRDLAKKLRYVKDGESTGRIVAKAVERKWLGVLNEYWINTILSGFKTHMLNLSSNSVNLFLLPAERAMGGIYQGMRGQGFKEAKIAAKQYKYLMHSMTESLHLAARTFGRENTTLDSAVKFDIGAGANNKSITAENLGVTGKYTGTAVDVVGKAARLPSRFLMAEDEFFKQLAFRSRLKAMIEFDIEDMSLEDIQSKGYSSKDEMFEAEVEKAFTQKSDAAEKFQELALMGKVLDDPEVKEKFIENALGSFNESNSYAIAAIREARAATFTTPLQKGTTGHSIQEFANRHPFARQIIPFIQTPMNIMKTAWDRTPGLNLIHAEYQQALNSPDEAIRAEAIGKLATGTITVGALSLLAMQGRITGGGPTDRREAANWRKSKDWQPYSVNFGTHENPYWVSFEKLDPHTTLFGIVGDAVEITSRVGDPNQDHTSMLAAIIASVGNNVISKTYLQGISDIVNVINSKDTPQEADRFLQQRLASFMPYSSMNTQLASVFEENLVEARGYVDTIKSKSIFLRGGLPTKYDWLTGEAVEGPESLQILPHITKKELKNEDKEVALVQAEMRKLGYAAQGPDRSIGGVELTGEQHNRWNELMGTVKLGGKTLTERLAHEIKKDRYQAYSQFDGEWTTQEDPRVDKIRSIVSDYKTRARKMLLREVPELKESVQNYKRYQRSLKAGRPVEKPEIDMNNIFK